METKYLKEQSLSESTFQWVKEKYLAIDSKNLDGFAKHLDESCTLQFGNNPIVNSKADVLIGIAAFWQSVAGLNHHFINLIGTDTLLALEALIQYTRINGKVVKIPCVTIIERNEKALATSIRIFLDTTPVYA
ncbi:MAG: hypothetical protein HC867_05255 [Bacteroidia bacterium]|nr:hypothetical protein [Bacteroidia bacterium]